VIGLSIEIHRALGPGLLESTYRKCLLYELTQHHFDVASEVPVPVTYRGVLVDCGYRADLIVGGKLLIEVKSVERLLPVHEAQVLTYLKLSGLHEGLLINFNAVRLVDGLRSFLN
jgi:GxxExxY protein